MNRMISEGWAEGRGEGGRSAKGWVCDTRRRGQQNKERLEEGAIVPLFLGILCEALELLFFRWQRMGCPRFSGDALHLPQWPRMFSKVSSLALLHWQGCDSVESGRWPFLPFCFSISHWTYEGGLSLLSWLYGSACGNIWEKFDEQLLELPLIFFIKIKLERKINITWHATKLSTFDLKLYNSQ